VPFAEEIVDLADKPEHFKRMYADLSPVPTARAKVPNQGCELKGSRGSHRHDLACGIPWHPAEDPSDRPSIGKRAIGKRARTITMTFGSTVRPAAVH
jgi:hypothetical protein